ncbi:MAG: choice-of-anchor B family protein [Balneolaceae bacterium]|nr:choice-of-anchor B family protein [Balneolaceae bacterium]
MQRLVLTFLGLLLSFSFNSVIAQTTSSGSFENMRGFARAVEVADGSIFIGESQNAHQPGMVYLYSKSADGWSQQLHLSASNGEVGDGFGSSLSADGNRILIGAPNIEDGSGAAFVFEKGDDGSWGQTVSLNLSDGESGIDFGASVKLHGNWAFVGAPEEQDEVGAVYVFKRGDNGWSQQARIANPDTTKGLAFGSSLAFNGTDLLVGAPKEQGGAVYLYNNENGAWTSNAALSSDRLDQNAQFGTAMALTDNQLLIGAPRHAAGSGIVFVYQKDSETGNWSSIGSLVAYDSAPRYSFGSSIALVESGAWIGAPGADGRKGALYQFEKHSSGQGWTGVSKVDGPERENGDQFAGTIAVNDEVAVVGLVGADYRAGTAAIMERGTADGMWTVQTTVIGKGTSVLEPITGNKVECSDGKASYFGCSNVDLLSFMPIQAIGGPRGVNLNDIWGWTDPQTGKEYAIVGRMDGTSFVDISNPTNPVYVANLQKPESARASVWRDMKVYKNHVYVVSDNAGQHGMQVVDLTDLREFDGQPLELEQVAHYDNIHSAHNVVINTETGYAFVVGSSGGGQTCGGGLHMVNIQDPANPTFAGCFSDPSTGRSGTGYTHDAQCVIYNGPDEDHQGDEVCFGANETAISIANVEDKENPQALSTMSYPDYGYVHQGWLTKDHKYFISNDELDELTGNVDSTRTLIWDVSDLDNPQFAREYFFDNASSDHNLYIKGNTMYQSNYVSGLQVVDVSNPVEPEKMGFFDTEPFGEDTPGFAGTWSNYPFFESGVVIMTSGSEGLFVLDVKND